jgi:hypothetical protein
METRLELRGAEGCGDDWPGASASKCAPDAVASGHTSPVVALDVPARLLRERAPKSTPTSTARSDAIETPLLTGARSAGEREPGRYPM